MFCTQQPAADPVLPPATTHGYSLFCALSGPAGAGSCRPPSLSTGNSSAGHGHGGALPHIPSSPKPPLAGGGYNSSGGSGGLLGSLSGIPASPAQESHLPGASLLQRASSGGPSAMQMSPPASPRVSAGGHHLMSLGSLGAGHRPAPRRQLVAVHESVTALEVSVGEVLRCAAGEWLCAVLC
jgi:hypothetical protein